MIIIVIIIIAVQNDEEGQTYADAVVPCFFPKPSSPRPPSIRRRTNYTPRYGLHQVHRLAFNTLDNFHDPPHETQTRKRQLTEDCHLVEPIRKENVSIPSETQLLLAGAYIAYKLNAVVGHN